jgi:hypothetical protein
MTPTLFGRWQTRIFLFSTIGILITIPFFILSGVGTYFFILFYVAILGLIWDILYNFFQKLRWDRDWIGVFQLLAGIGEGLFLFSLIKLFKLPGIPEDITFFTFAFHYSCVWLGIYTSSQTLMRILFPRWRFWGGQLF